MLGQMFSAPTCSWNSACCISAAGCVARAAQDQRRGRRRAAGRRDPRAPAGRWRRSRSCCAAAGSRSAAASSMSSTMLRDLSVAPNRNGPWMRKTATYSGMSLSCRMCDAPGLDVLRRHLRHRRRLRHLADEQQRRQHHADFDRHRQVGEDGQRERHQPDADVGLVSFSSSRDLAPLAHVAGDHQQDRRPAPPAA